MDCLRRRRGSKMEGKKDEEEEKEEKGEDNYKGRKRNKYEERKGARNGGKIKRTIRRGRQKRQR